jgi:hypothetical protein
MLPSAPVSARERSLRKLRLSEVAEKLTRAVRERATLRQMRKVRSNWLPTRRLR